VRSIVFRYGAHTDTTPWSTSHPSLSISFALLKSEPFDIDRLSVSIHIGAAGVSNRVRRVDKVVLRVGARRWTGAGGTPDAGAELGRRCAAAAAWLGRRGRTAALTTVVVSALLVVVEYSVRTMTVSW
jgi:hypothetical protein